MSGAVIACISFIISMFATNITYLQLSLGVVGGKLLLLLFLN